MTEHGWTRVMALEELPEDLPTHANLDGMAVLLYRAGERNQEIAVAILAELVQLRAAGELGAGTATVVAERHEEIDPVCHMTVEVSTARYRTTHEGRTYYFCSAGCLERFSADPVSFLTAPTP